VRTGLGAAILPSAAFDMGELSGLRIRQLHEATLSREIGVLKRADRPLSTAASSFFEAVISSPGILALKRTSQRPDS